jgi:hypothetical protein
LEAQLVRSLFRYHIEISLVKQLFVKSEIFAQVPFNTISHDSLSASATDRYSESCITGIFARPHYYEVFRMAFPAGRGKTQKILPFSQAFLFAK